MSGVAQFNSKRVRDRMYATAESVAYGTENSMTLCRLLDATAFAVILGVGIMTAANADDSPNTVFQLQNRRNVSAGCDPAYRAAEQLSAANGDVTAAQAHTATRAFLDCAERPSSSQERRNRYIVFAGASELIAAAHESGDDAVRSRRNAVVLLTPISQRYFKIFDVGYVDVDGSDGTSGIVASVREDGTNYRHRTPSRFSTISSELLAQAQTGTCEHSLI